MSDPIDLDAHRPHEVSKMLCARCGHKWTAVHPVGTTGLECPNCHEMEGYGMNKLVERVAREVCKLDGPPDEIIFGNQRAWTMDVDVARAAIRAVAEHLAVFGYPYVKDHLLEQLDDKQ